MWYPELTPAAAAEALSRAGLALDPGQLRVEAREQRWLAWLPGQRLAWFAASAQGERLLERERRVLRLLEARCSFQAPRVVIEDTEGGFDVRTMVAGIADPGRVRAHVRGNSAVALAIGTAVGALLAEQHTRIASAEVSSWLPAKPTWPETAAWIGTRLPRMVDDRALVGEARAVIDRYHATAVDGADRVLVHNDVGFHNLGIDPISNAVHGIFDYEEATLGDRHHDFRYLVFDIDRYDLLDAACAAYQPLAGRPIHRARVLLYNAACAITFLASRDGHALPGDRWCGRTLAEDLAWSRWAIARAQVTD
jgi:aminoglycoside phosphotransferase (APT) family kinase protein